MGIHRLMSEARTSIGVPAVQLWSKGKFSTQIRGFLSIYDCDHVGGKHGRRCRTQSSSHVPIMYPTCTCHMVIIMSRFHARLLWFFIADWFVFTCPGDSIDICGLCRHIRQVPLILPVLCCPWNLVQSPWYSVLKSFWFVRQTCFVLAFLCRIVASCSFFLASARSAVRYF